jgi:putative ATPase
VLSAVLAGVKDIREAVEQAQACAAGPRTVVFVDEVHRFNKAQQDAFLPHVEVGPVHLHRRHHREPVVRGQLGAAVARHGARAASRWTTTTWASCWTARSPAAGAAADRAARARSSWPMPTATAPPAQRLREPGRWPARWPRSTSPCWKLRWANAAPLRQGRRPVLRHHLGAAQVGARLRPRRRAVLAGAHARRRHADPRYAARRLVRMASEDIGLADPRALRLALDAAEVYERLGSPEGELALAQAVVYLAVAPKSNAVYKAWNAVRAWCGRRHPPGARCTCAMHRRG